MGAAVIAKLAARTEDSVRKISSADVIMFLKKLRTSNLRSTTAKGTIIKYFTKVFDIHKSATDKLTITMHLTNDAYATLFPDLQTSLKIPNLNTLIASAVTYVNRRDVEEKAIEFFLNRKDDHITIEVDGISGKAGSNKADILVSHNDVVFSKVSLKTVSKQFGQVYGGPFENYVALLGDGGMTGKGSNRRHVVGLGLPVNTKTIEDEFNAIMNSGPRSQTTVQKAVKFMFTEAVKLVAAQPAARMANTIINFLRYHATANDDMVKIVILERIKAGRHKILDPKRLHSELRKIPSIRAHIKMDGQWPILLFYVGGTPPETIDRPNCLFGIRPKWSNRDVQVQNVIEKGPLMTTLAEVPEEKD
jgi:hypothetical protein